MSVYLSLLVAVIGLIAYAVSVNPKLAEIGRLAFFAGLLAFLLRVSRLIEVLPR